MHKLNKLAFTNVWQFSGDILFLLIAYIASYFIVSKMVYLWPILDYFWVLVVYVPFWAFSMGLMGMYNKTTFTYYDRIFRNVVFATVIAGTAVAVLFYLTKNSYFSRKFYACFIILTIFLILIERYTLLSIFKRFREVSDNRVLIVGTQNIIDKFKYYLNKTQISMNIQGYMKIDESLPLDYECMGTLDDLPEILKDNILDEIVFAIPKEYMSNVEEYIYLCEKMGVTVRLLLDLYDLKVAKTNISSMGTIPMLTYHTVSLNNVQLFGKRVLDIIGSLVGIIITGMVSIFVIPLIKLDSPGPVFFKQDRVGLHGRIFKLYKFRSMQVDAEQRKKDLMKQNQVKDGMMFKVKNDPRITRVGKFLRKTSLDELPQFWNVLKGDMSLVGTRPPTTDEVSKYLSGHWRRISIKPGLTGLWQISGRSSIMNFDEVVKLDTCYIDQWSISEDIKIILKTIPAMFTKRGAM